MFTEYLPTLDQDDDPLTASSAENLAYRNENRGVTTPYVALDRTFTNPVLCILNGNATTAVPLMMDHFYSSLPPYYAHLLRAALQIDCPYALDEWLTEQWVMALVTKRFTRPAFYASPYLGDGIALLTRKGVRCYHPDVTQLPYQQILTPFYAPSCNADGQASDPLLSLLENTLPYANRTVALLAEMPLDHTTPPALTRWLMAWAQVVGLSRQQWCLVNQALRSATHS